IIEMRRAKPSPQPDLLDQLLAARDPETGRGMSDAEGVNNLLTFIAAGHETTAVALTWTPWLLAKDQASPPRARCEVVDVVGAGAFTAAHVDRLVFCRQIICEAMRLYPAAPGVGRLPHKPMVLGRAGQRPNPRPHSHIRAPTEQALVGEPEHLRHRSL